MASLFSVLKGGGQKPQQPEVDRHNDTTLEPSVEAGNGSVASSGPPEPFPLLPRSSSGTLLARTWTGGSRTSTKNPPHNLHRRTSSKYLYARSNTNSGVRDKTKEEDGPRDQDGDKAGDRKTESVRSENATKGAPNAPPSTAPTWESSATTSAAAIDPLSQHIFRRTNTDHTIPQRLRNPQRPDSPSTDGLLRPSPDLALKQTTPLGESWKDKKGVKGVSFLSRLSMRGSGRKKDDLDDSNSDLGTDGASARVFSQAIAAPGAGGGYIPRHKEPPRYIRTKAYNTKSREFSRMFLAQELIGTRPLKRGGSSGGEATAGGPAADAGYGTVPLTGTTTRLGGIREPQQTGGAIWATEFSKDGKYLAAGGRDQIVRVWAVISTAEERKAHEEEEMSQGGSGERLSAPVFRERPYREFEGHTGEILDLSWSKNSFLLSSSMDKTVRLWHITRKECLCTFKHKDFVTKLAFHPRDDRFFLAGSLDTMLRLWSIPDKSIAYSAQLPDMVTAVAFSPDGRTAIAGVLNGLCLFYDTEGLKYQDQIHVRSTRGKNAKGSKITGISTMLISPHPSTASSQGTVMGFASSRTSSDLASLDAVKVLVTSNDSRIRVYNMRDKSLEAKLKGHENVCSQIAASFSDDGRHIICGSEDRKAFIWSTTSTGADESRDKRPYECFEAHADIVTTAIFAPTRTRILLGGSGDPIFDLCNPPPVTLRSLDEGAGASASNSQVTLGTHGEAEPQGPRPTKRPEESPAYIARSTHYDGNIIVTTDDTGVVKVFRQDCAFAKRRHDAWETASSTFGRKPSHSLGGGFSVASGLGRSGSILSRTSAGTQAHSRRASLSQPGHGSSSNVATAHHLAGLNGSSDRILSWRQGIEGNGGRRPVSSIFSNPGVAAQVQQQRSERSPSPRKSGTQLGEARRLTYTNSPTISKPGAGSLASPTASNYGSIRSEQPLSPAWQVQKETQETKAEDRKEEDRKVEDRKDGDKKDDKDGPLPTPSFSLVPAVEEENPLSLDAAGASYSFWSLNRWRGITARNAAANSAPRPAGTMGSHGRSKLSAREWNNNNTSSSNNSSIPRLEGVKEDAGETRPPPPAHLHQRRKSAVSPGTGTPEPGAEDRALRRRTLPASALLSPPGADQAPTDEWPDASPYGSPYSRDNSVASRLTSEMDFEGDSGENDDAEEEETRCVKCGGREFKARRVAGRQTLSCGRCGRMVD